MENNEIMNYEDIEMMDNIMAEEGTGIGTGVAMLIGVGLTFAAGAAVKLGKNLYAKHKAKKELHLAEKEIIVEPEDVAEVAAK